VTIKQKGEGGKIGVRSQKPEVRSQESGARIKHNDYKEDLAKIRPLAPSPIFI
jgi:hypothetical protein